MHGAAGRHGDTYFQHAGRSRLSGRDFITQARGAGWLAEPPNTPSKQLPRDAGRKEMP